MARGRGRPKKEASPLSRDAILSAALERLGSPHSQPLSLRLLARDLGVTPMALYSHVEGVDDILHGLAERRFEDVPDKAATADAEAIEQHLNWYCERVLGHVGLTLALVSRRGDLPRPHETWTQHLRHMVAEVGLPKEWSDILVDHLHGFTLSHLASGEYPAQSLAEYGRQIAVLLRTILPGRQRDCG
jgi:AcrR family transcriptional regulator